MNIEISEIANLPSRFGDFKVKVFKEGCKEHLVLYKEPLDEVPIVRVHSECLTGDALFSQKCDCGPQLQAAMQAIQAAGRGVIVYLRQEGRGIGLINKIRAYQLQDQGLDTVEANVALGLPVDARDFTLAKSIFDYLDIQAIRLLTNNPQKVQVLADTGINIVERVPLNVGEHLENERYLNTKAIKLGHFIDH